MVIHYETPWYWLRTCVEHSVDPLNLTSHVRNFWGSFCGRRKGQFLLICIQRSHPSVNVRSSWSRSRECKVELVACGFRLEWHVNWRLAAVLSARLSCLILPLWTLNLRCMISCWLLPFMGLIGVLPTISGHYFALCKTGLSYTNLTNMAQERCWPLPFYSNSISSHYCCIFHAVSYMGRSVHRIKVFRKSWKFQRILLW